MTTIEIRFTRNRHPNGKRMAIYRVAGTTRYWHMMPIRQAEKALKTGFVSVGIHENVPAIAA